VLGGQCTLAASADNTSRDTARWCTAHELQQYVETEATRSKWGATVLAAVQQREQADWNERTRTAKAKRSSDR